MAAFSRILPRVGYWCESLQCIRSVRLFLVFAVIIIAYNEWLCIHVASLSWQLIGTNSIQEKQQQHDSRVKLLVVSDPQILSTLSEPHYPFSVPAIWDANRFMKNTFSLALSSTRPDAVLFLGDILNDGSVSGNDDFNALVTEFHRVFPIPESVKTIVIPGDNDVGGEGMDFATKEKLDRFKNSFSLPLRTNFKFLEFVHVPRAESLPAVSNHRPNTYRILLSHWPLLPGVSYRELILREKPDLIFSGHFHESFHFKGLKKEGRAAQFFPLYDPIMNVSLTSEFLNEIIVPTCSYRMGKRNYGYGFAVIDKSGWMQYTVLWLPSRFTHLLIYLLTITITVLIFGLPRLCRLAYSAYARVKIALKPQERYNLSARRAAYMRLTNVAYS